MVREVREGPAAWITTPTPGPAASAKGDFAGRPKRFHGFDLLARARMG
jgi:hypothetical protein